MSYFEDIMDNLKQNEEVPPQVLAKLDAVLENLPDYEYQESAPKSMDQGCRCSGGIDHRYRYLFIQTRRLLPKYRSLAGFLQR